jgi:hypothetical protein
MFPQICLHLLQHHRGSNVAGSGCLWRGSRPPAFKFASTLSLHLPLRVWTRTLRELAASRRINVLCRDTLSSDGAQFFGSSVGTPAFKLASTSFRRSPAFNPSKLVQLVSERLQKPGHTGSIAYIQKTYGAIFAGCCASTGKQNHQSIAARTNLMIL